VIELIDHLFRHECLVFQAEMQVIAAWNVHALGDGPKTGDLTAWATARKMSCLGCDQR